MKSGTPKVLHKICGETMLGLVLAVAREVDPERLIVVVGHRRRQVTEFLNGHAADATPEQRAIQEINSGVYAFEARLLGDVIKRVPTDNAKGEEYLTDVVAILRAESHRVASVVLEDSDEVLGVNDRAQLARARQILNTRLLGVWMRAGVT